MFDSNLTCRQSNTQNIKINAVTGAILKNHPKSWFERFHLDSPRGKELLEEGGHRGGGIIPAPIIPTMIRKRMSLYSKWCYVGIWKLSQNACTQKIIKKFWIEKVSKL